jgi:phage terminase small subunit
MADASEKLSELESGFVAAYLATGGVNATQAALTAGYSENGAAVRAHELLKRPRVLAAIREGAEQALQRGVAMAADVLADLAKNAKSEAVKLKAAEALLDRGGLMLVARSEHTLNIVDKRSDAELREQVARLTRELGLGAVVIDGAAAPAAPAQPPALPRPVVDVLDAEPAGDDLPDLFS